MNCTNKQKLKGLLFFVVITLTILIKTPLVGATTYFTDDFSNAQNSNGTMFMREMLGEQFVYSFVDPGPGDLFEYDNFPYDPSRNSAIDVTFSRDFSFSLKRSDGGLFIINSIFIKNNPEFVSIFGYKNNSQVFSNQVPMNAMNTVTFQELEIDKLVFSGSNFNFDDVKIALVNNAPTVSSAFITGISEVGKALTGNYVYTDIDDDEEGAATYQWYRANDRSGSGKVAISGATNKTYILTDEDKYKYISFEVTATAKTGVLTGNKIESTSVGPILFVSISNAPPTVSSVFLTSTEGPVQSPFLPGRTLVGNYTYDDAEEDNEYASTYQWYRSNDASGNGKTAISGATNKYYTLSKEDQEKYISFEVTPMANSGTSQGNAIESERIAIANISYTTDTFSDLQNNYYGSLFNRIIDNVPFIYSGGSLNVGTVDDEIIWMGDDIGQPITLLGRNYELFFSNSIYLYIQNDTSVTIQGELYGKKVYEKVIEGPFKEILQLDNELIDKLIITPSNYGYSICCFKDVTIAPVPNVAPVAHQVFVSGTPEVGQTLTGYYQYYDNERHNEFSSTFQWYRSTDVSGNDKTPIPGATGKTYTVTKDDRGKYISFEVVPKSKIAQTTKTGLPSESPKIGPVVGNMAPTGSISIENNMVATNSSNTTLHLSGSDAEDDSLEMQFSTDTILWSDWEPYSSTKLFTLEGAEGEKTIYFKLRDSFSLESAVYTTTIIFDKTPPIVTGITDGAIGKEDVVITFNEGTATLNGEAYTNGSTVKGTGEYTLIVTDHAGNNTTVHFTLDQTAPTGMITYSTTEATNEQVIATLTANETITIKNNNGSNQYSFTDNGSFTFEFADELGNVGTATATVQNIDQTEPIGTITYSTTDPTNGDVVATLTPNEDVTITNNEGASTYTFEKNGSFTFEFEDTVGNKGTATATVNNIDKQAPVVTGVTDGAKVKNDVTLSFDEGTAKLNDQDYTKETKISGSGVYKLVVTDAAGNMTTVTFTIDQAEPIGTITYSTTNPTNGDVVATLTPNEDVTITNNEGASTYTFEENGSFTFEFEDAVGNNGTAIATVDNIDKQAPVVTGVTDGLRSKDAIRISFNEGTAILNGVDFFTDSTISELGDYVLMVIDAAGNETQITFSIVPPAPTVSANDSLNTILGIDESMEYQIDSGQWTVYNKSTPLDLSGNKIVKVRLRANGNIPTGEEITLVFTINPSAGVSTPIPVIFAPENNKPVIENGMLSIQVQDSTTGLWKSAPISQAQSIGGYFIVQTGSSNASQGNLPAIELPKGQNKVVVLHNDKPYNYFDVSTNTEADKQWTIKFSNPLVNTSKNLENVIVQDAEGNKVDVKISLSKDGKTITVTPKNPYKKGELFYMTITDIVGKNKVLQKQPIRKVFIIE